jgi:hypothetical protein
MGGTRWPVCPAGRALAGTIGMMPLTTPPGCSASFIILTLFGSQTRR